MVHKSIATCLHGVDSQKEIFLMYNSVTCFKNHHDLINNCYISTGHMKTTDCFVLLTTVGCETELGNIAQTATSSSCNSGTSGDYCSTVTLSSG